MNRFFFTEIVLKEKKPRENYFQLDVVRHLQLHPDLSRPTTIVFVSSEYKARLKIIQNWKLIYKAKGVFLAFVQYTKIQVLGQMLSSNKIAHFFVHQCFPKELIGLVDFIHKNSHQRINKTETNTFIWVWPAFASHT